MPNFIIALIVVFGGLWLIRKFAKTSPSQAAGLSRKLAGGGLIALFWGQALTQSYLQLLATP